VPAGERARAPDLAIWNDFVCPGPAAAEHLLREAA
jgi:hypothetical protein